MEPFYWLSWPESEPQPYFITLLPHLTGRDIVVSLRLQSTFHQDVFTLTEWVLFCRPWAWSFLELSINSLLDLWVLARIFFRCILSSIALLQPDLGHLEASSEPGRFNRVVVYSPTWECIQCIQCIQCILYTVSLCQMQWHFLHRSYCDCQESKV